MPFEKAGDVVSRDSAKRAQHEVEREARQREQDKRGDTQPDDSVCDYPGYNKSHVYNQRQRSSERRSDRWNHIWNGNHYGYTGDGLDDHDS